MLLSFYCVNVSFFLYSPQAHGVSIRSKRSDEENSYCFAGYCANEGALLRDVSMFARYSPVTSCLRHNLFGTRLPSGACAALVSRFLSLTFDALW